jgi:hypothetical protein
MVGPWDGEGLDQGCAAKTWATAPALKTVVLIGSMVSGALKIRSPAGEPELEAFLANLSTGLGTPVRR